MKNVLKIWLSVVIPWTIYRLVFRFPEYVDELLVKPLIFILLPLGITKAKTIPGFDKRKNVFEDIIIGAAIGFVFAFVALLSNKLKYGSFLFNPILPVYGKGLILYLGLSLATGITEEILGRGFFFNTLKKHWSLLSSATVSSLLSLSMHFPILFTQLHLSGATLSVFLCSVFLLSMVNCYLYENRGSLVLPILIHMFWNMTVALYL